MEGQYKTTASQIADIALDIEDTAIHSSLLLNKQGEQIHSLQDKILGVFSGLRSGWNNIRKMERNDLIIKVVLVLFILSCILIMIGIVIILGYNVYRNIVK